MQKQIEDEEGFRALRLRSATPVDGPFLLNLFATTRADELSLMNWDENQKQTSSRCNLRHKASIM